MNVDYDAGTEAAGVAAAIGERARAQMLLLLMDGLARTSTELALAADISPPTASAHLNRLRAEGLVKVLRQGRHRYYSIAGPAVADAMEALTVLAGGRRTPAAPRTPSHLRAARTCYDHMAGVLGVELHDALMDRGWLAPVADATDAYDVSPDGLRAFQRLGVDISAAHALRRRFAFACPDWSERRPHLGGALGAAILDLALRKRWVARVRDSRALSVTPLGERELRALARGR
jgi:DNA-binding transcriptional ArsR family regulator